LKRRGKGMGRKGSRGPNSKAWGWKGEMREGKGERKWRDKEVMEGRSLHPIVKLQLMCMLD